jgi:peptide/nickel transport system substrate-binding protein
MKTQKFSALLIITCLIGSLFTACAPAPAANSVQDVQGDIFTMRIQEDPETLDNVRTTSGTAEAVMSHTILERLIYIDQNNVMHGWLAESWQVSTDQKEVTFKLRQGVKFTDGTDFNADAVKFHFDRIMDKRNASPSLAYIGSLKQVAVVDPYTVKLVFASPYAGLWNVLNYAYFGFNSPTAVKQWGDEYGRHPVGTGPFILKEWIPGSKLTFVRNPNYVQYREDATNKGPAKLAKMVFLVIPEDGTAMAALQTGEITISGLNSDTLAQVQNDNRFKVVINKNGTHLQYVEFNYERAPFNDPLFREAISYAVDRESIVKSSRGGYASVDYSPLAVGLIGYDDAVAKQYGTPYNPQKAKDLLAQAGWKDTNGDGIVEKDGKSANFELRSYTGYTYITRSLEVFQKNLQDIGIKATPSLTDWGAFYPSLTKKDWDIAMIGWNWGDANVLKVLFRSPGHRGQIPADGTLDPVLDSLDTTMDPAQRIKIASEAQKLILQKYLVVPIQCAWNMFAIQANVMDLHYDHYGYFLMGDLWIQK